MAVDVITLWQGAQGGKVRKWTAAGGWVDLPLVAGGNANIWSISGTSDDDLWLGIEWGTTTQIWHWDGNTWTQHTLTGATTTRSISVHALSASVVFAVQQRHLASFSQLFQWDGIGTTTWTKRGVEFRQWAGITTDDGLIVKASNDVIICNGARPYRWDGASLVNWTGGLPNDGAAIGKAFGLFAYPGIEHVSAQGLNYTVRNGGAGVAGRLYQAPDPSGSAWIAADAFEWDVGGGFSNEWWAPNFGNCMASDRDGNLWILVLGTFKRGILKRTPAGVYTEWDLTSIITDTGCEIAVTLPLAVTAGQPLGSIFNGTIWAAAPSGISVPRGVHALGPPIPPIITPLDPTNGQVDVEKDTPISFTVTDESGDLDFLSIKAWINGVLIFSEGKATGGWIATSIAISGPDGYKVILDHINRDTYFEDGEQINARVFAEDDEHNQDEESWSFSVTRKLRMKIYPMVLGSVRKQDETEDR